MLSNICYKLFNISKLFKGSVEYGDTIVLQSPLEMYKNGKSAMLKDKSEIL